MAMWNLWHGCSRISPGCANCYVYRSDARYGRDSRHVTKTKSFDLPVRKDRHGAYKLPAGEIVYTCFTSDFFIEDADEWRGEAWAMMKARPDLTFLIITKRIHRLLETLPDDWGGGYENVVVYATVESQTMADYRLPLLERAPLRHKGVVCEPLLERVDLSGFLARGPRASSSAANPDRTPGSAITTGFWTSGISASRPACRLPSSRRGTGF